MWDGVHQLLIGKHKVREHESSFSISELDICSMFDSFIVTKKCPRGQKFTK